MNRRHFFKSVAISMLSIGSVPMPVMPIVEKKHFTWLSIGGDAMLLECSPVGRVKLIVTYRKQPDGSFRKGVKE